MNKISVIPMIWENEREIKNGKIKENIAQDSQREGTKDKDNEAHNNCE